MKKVPIIIGIYKITSPIGRIYVGQSFGINGRWKTYFKLRCKKQPELYDSLLEYGVENHTFEIIHVIEKCELTKLEIKLELNRLEVYYIKLFDSFNTPHGLNLTSGGGSKKIVSDETRKRLRESHLGQVAWNKGIKLPEHSERMSGENNPMYGFKFSTESIIEREEIKRKIKEQKIADGTYVPITRSPEAIEKGLETKRKIEEEQKANGTYVKPTRSVETRKKISESKKNMTQEEKDAATKKQLETKNNRTQEEKDAVTAKTNATKRKKKEKQIADGTYVKRKFSPESLAKKQEKEISIKN